MRKVLLLAFALGGVVSAQAAVVYDDMSNLLGYYYSQFSGLEVGDNVTLAGTERVVNRFAVGVYSFSAGTADMRVRFYSATPDVNPIAIYDTGWMASTAIANGQQTLTFAVPNVVVPDNFTWTVQYANPLGMTDIGPRMADPPTVGSSGNDFWQNNPPWVNYWFGGVPVANFMAQVNAEAVPEPASLTALALGGLALLRRRRK